MLVLPPTEFPSISYAFFYEKGLFLFKVTPISQVATLSYRITQLVSRPRIGRSCGRETRIMKRKVEFLCCVVFILLPHQVNHFPCELQGLLRQNRNEKSFLQVLKFIWQQTGYANTTNCIKKFSWLFSWLIQENTRESCSLSLIYSFNYIA